MKKLILLPLVLLAFVSFTSCEQESLDPLPVKVAGNYVTIDAYNTSMDFTQIDNTAFRGMLRTPGNNIVRYELYVRRKTPNGVNTSNFVHLQTITSFPYEFNITPAQIADALDVDLSTLEAGDTYRFLGYSYDAAGHETSFLNLSAVVRTTPTMKQGYKFSANLVSVINPENPFPLYDTFSL